MSGSIRLNYDNSILMVIVMINLRFSYIWLRNQIVAEVAQIKK